MTAAERKTFQQVCGVFLYYARAVGPTMQHVLNNLAAQQSNGTEKTLQAMKHFLNYCSTHPDAYIRYHASDMQLWKHSDTSYLNEPEGHSRLGGHHF